MTLRGQPRSRVLPFDLGRNAYLTTSCGELARLPGLRGLVATQSLVFESSCSVER